MSHPLSLRRAVVPLAVITGVLLTASPVMAGSPQPPVNKVSGKVGSYGLTDTSATPGATCFYGYKPDGVYYNGVAKIKARPPIAYARAGKSSQRISWRLVVRAWETDKWVKVKASSWQSKRATPTAQASFTAKSLKIKSRPYHGLRSPYQAKVVVRWHGKNNKKVVGKAKLFPHYYAGKEEGSFDFPQENWCVGTTG